MLSRPVSRLHFPTASLLNEVGLFPPGARRFVCCAEADDCNCLCCVRLRGAQVCLWAHASCYGSRHAMPGRMVLVQDYCARPQPSPSPPSNIPTPDGKSAAEVVKKRVVAVLWVK